MIDYTRPNIDQRVLMEKETGRYDYRYVYGLNNLRVKITSEGTNWWGQNVKQDILKDYYHCYHTLY